MAFALHGSVIADANLRYNSSVDFTNILCLSFFATCKQKYRCTLLCTLPAYSHTSWCMSPTYWDTCELHAIMRTHRNSIYLVYRHRSNLAPYNGCWFLKLKIINRMDTVMFVASSTWPYVVKCEPHFLPGDMRITLRSACTTQWNLIYRFYRHKLNLAYKLLMMSNQLKRATALSCALIHPTD